MLNRLKEAGLKLKPSKCHFVGTEVKYLGHLVTPQGLKANSRIVEAVRNYPTPRNVRQVRQFLRISSFYRRFISRFAKIAYPLHAFTRKDDHFEWDADCQSAFKTLKQRLVEAPVLAYPDFTKPFSLETDASIEGLGAILSQRGDDKKLHPVAYASRSVSVPKRTTPLRNLKPLP